MIPEESRFEPDPEELVAKPEGLPAGLAGRDARPGRPRRRRPADRAAARPRARGPRLGRRRAEDVLVEVSGAGLGPGRTSWSATRPA